MSDDTRLEGKIKAQITRFASRRLRVAGRYQRRRPALRNRR